MFFVIEAKEPIASGTGRAPNYYRKEFEAVALDEVLPEIEAFLRGCGYFIYNIDYDTNLPDQ